MRTDDREKVRMLACLLTWGLAVVGRPASAIEIVVDYTYDTRSFFDEQHKREAIETAAARYSQLITSSLLPANPAGTPWRVGFTHPGTGKDAYQLSTAVSLAEDPIASRPADEYGFEGIEADQWILFVGGRELDSAAQGGTATGLNFTNVFDDENGHLHRGLISNTPEDSVADLPVWGGVVSFNTEVDWHFAIDNAAPLEKTDFYTVAIHEIGHALGASTSWNQWTQHVEGDQFVGPNVVAAYNRDNGANVRSLTLVDDVDMHWKDDTYQSKIFAPPNAQLVGTVGGELQDLLFEPSVSLTAEIRRLELTNVDVASLVDVGWSVASAVENVLDRNADAVVNLEDMNLACTSSADLGPYFEALGTVLADLDLNGAVNFSDFVALSRNFNRPGRYSDGDFSCDGHVEFNDFIILSNQFGSSAAAAVPEPPAVNWFWIAILVVTHPRRRFLKTTT